MIFEFILLQLPPDPGQWGDPDAMPVNQHVVALLIGAILLGAISIWIQSRKKEKTAY